MKKYCIDPGKTDFRPREFPFIWPVRMFAFELNFSFTESCIYDWGDDRDADDWNKVGGISLKLTNHKINSIMAAWRPNPDKGEIDVTIYRHINGKVFKGDGTTGETMLSLQPKGHGRLLIVPFNRGKTFVASLESVKDSIRPNPLNIEFSKKHFLAKRIGTWFGGSNNSAGEFGGVASQYMEMWHGFRLIGRGR